MSEETPLNYENDDKPFVVAYEFQSKEENELFTLTESKPNRSWMDNTPNKFAYRCLPLIMGNSIGWQISVNFPFLVFWNGGKEISDISLGFFEQDNQKILAQRKAVTSHFGSGIVTFSLPWLFRTNRGHNLFVTGPINEPKNGTTPLSGVVETDWLPFTFTMNWKITTPNTPIKFEKGDVICQFFPYPRGYPEKFTALTDKIANNPSVLHEYSKWHNSRDTFNKKLADPNDPEVTGKDWERNYFQGKHKDGSDFDEHQTRYRSCPFRHLPKGKET